MTKAFFYSILLSTVTVIRWKHNYKCYWRCGCVMYWYKSKLTFSPTLIPFPVISGILFAFPLRFLTGSLCCLIIKWSEVLLYVCHHLQSVSPWLIQCYQQTFSSLFYPVFWSLVTCVEQCRLQHRAMWDTTCDLSLLWKAIICSCPFSLPSEHFFMSDYLPQ